MLVLVFSLLYGWPYPRRGWDNRSLMS